MSRPRKSALSLLALAGLGALLLAASCMDDFVIGGPRLDVNRCTADDTCSQHGGTCDAELGACIDPALLEQGLVLQVVEPDTAASSEHLLSVSEVNGAEPTTLRLRRPVVVRGLVVDTRDGGGSEPIPSRLTFKREPDLAGLSTEPLYAESTTSVFADGRDESNNFEISIPPGTYLVEVEPTVETPAQRPEQLYYPQRQVVEVAPAASEVTYVDFRYGPETRRVVGVVTDAAGQRLGGVRIFAHGPDDARRLSNVALTECPEPESDRCGRFELAVPGDVNAFRLRMEGAVADPRLPIVDRAGYAFNDRDLDGDGVISPDELGEVRYPAVGDPVLVEAQVVGEDRAGARNPLSGATVLFQTDGIGDPASPVGSMEARATTDDEGNAVAEGRLAPESGAGIWLPPATYAVTITPPADSGYASAEIEVAVESSDDPEEPLVLDLLVGPRLRVSGRVVTPDGTPVPQVGLEATSRDGGGTSSATGEDDGSFAVDVDPGRYDILVVTPEQSLLPWVPLLDMSVFGDILEDVTASYGAPVRGRLVREPALDADPYEEPPPVAGAAVNAFVEVTDEGGETRLVRVGRAVTDEQGLFTVLVPGLDR